MGAKAFVEGDEERTDGHGWNKGSAALRTRPHLANPAISKRKRSKGFPLLKKYLQRKAYANVIKEVPVSIPSRQQDLAVSTTWFWL